MSARISRTPPARPGSWQAQLGNWSAGLSYGDLPGPVVRAALRSIVDVVGVGLAGSGTAVGGILAAALPDRAACRPATALGTGPATAIGTGRCLTAGEAALFNGTVCHALDFDDTSCSLLGHPSAVVLPAALAAAETSAAETSGKGLILAYVAGIEAACQLGRVLAAPLFGAGWFTTASLGVFGAVIAAAKAWGLPARQTEMALAIAGGMASGTRANNGTAAKPYQAGLAARAGVEAADLARRGLDGARDIFAGRDGYLQVTGSPATCPPGLADRLGHPFELVSPGLALKRYPCCSGIAAAVDALLGLRAEAGFDWRDVRQVSCETTELVRRSLPYRDPRTWREAQFSLSYCLGHALVHGELGLAAFSGEAIRDAAVREAMRRIEVTFGLADPSGRSEGARVEVRLGTGPALRREVPHACGTPQLPLPDAEVAAKFRRCAAAALDPHQAEGLLQALLGLPRGSAGQVTGYLRAAPAPGRPPAAPAPGRPPAAPARLGGMTQ